MMFLRLSLLSSIGLQMRLYYFMRLMLILVVIWLPLSLDSISGSIYGRCRLLYTYAVSNMSWRPLFSSVCLVMKVTRSFRCKCRRTLCFINSRCVSSYFFMIIWLYRGLLFRSSFECNLSSSGLISANERSKASLLSWPISLLCLIKPSISFSISYRFSRLN